MPSVSLKFLSLVTACVLLAGVAHATQSTAPIRDQVTEASELGAASLALDLASTDRKAFSDLEFYTLEHAALAQRLRWSRSEMDRLTGPERTNTLDIALAEGARLLNDLSPSGEYADLRKLVVYDMIYGLSMRGRMQEAIALFESLGEPWSETYPYVLVAAATAYTYEEQLDTAIELYEYALEHSEPQDIDRGGAREDLFYAYLDRGRYEDARDLLTFIEKESPMWMDSSPVPETPNYDYLRYHRLRAQYLLYSGHTEAGMLAVNALKHDAPFSSSLRNAASSARMGDGRPMEARDAFHTALLERPNDVDAVVGLARSSIMVRDYAVADRIVQSLAQRFPEVGRVKSLKRDYEISQAPLIVIDGGITFGDDAAVATTKREWSLDTRAYTGAINHNWRVFGHQFVGRAKLEDGHRSRVRNGIGVDYRAPAIEAAAEVHRSNGHGGRYGVSGEVHYYPRDSWRFSAQADTDSNELPWRAYEDGVHGWQVGGAARYQPTSRTYIDFTYDFSRYSDANRRHQFSVTWFQNVFSIPRHSVSTWASLGHSRNSEQKVSYFSPRHDLTAQLTGMYEWNPWRNGQYAFKQRVYASVGSYRQADFSSKGLWELRLEQVWELQRQVSIVYGVGHGRRPYDGVQESRTLVYFSLNIPF